MLWSLRKRNKVNSQGKRELEAFFGKGIHFEGDLKFEGTLRIDGFFEGEIEGGTLIVGADGVIHSDISVSHIVVYGEVRGNIRADKRIDIDALGKVYGNIEAPSIVIHDGALLEGTCRMEGESKALAAVIPIDAVSQEEVNLLRRGADLQDMREMTEQDVLLARVKLLIIMCAAYLKDYPLGEYRRDAIIENANHVATGSGDVPVCRELTQGDSNATDGMDRTYVLRERVRLLALMAKGFAEGNPMGQFRRQALEENIEFIGGAINFSNQTIDMRFLRVA